MIKVYIFNKSNNISTVYDFEKFFQCIDSEISLTHCTGCQRYLRQEMRKSLQFYEIQNGTALTNG